jgi:hypothetical protein
MSALAIAQLISMFAQALPQLLTLAESVKSTLSTEDQATIDAAIAQLRAAASADVDKATADLDAAAKG